MSTFWIFKVTISDWTPDPAAGLHRNFQQKLAYSEIPDKLLDGIPGKTDAFLMFFICVLH
jgi:hypothetical protein